MVGRWVELKGYACRAIQAWLSQRDRRGAVRHTFILPLISSHAVACRARTVLKCSEPRVNVVRKLVHCSVVVPSTIDTRNRSLSNIGRARCAAINSDFFKIIISKYINYTIGINDNNCVFVCNLILGW